MKWFYFFQVFPFKGVNLVNTLVNTGVEVKNCQHMVVSVMGVKKNAFKMKHEEIKELRKN